MGETLQLYTGMRTKACRKLGVAICTAVYGVRIDLADGRVETETGTAWTTLAELDAFAESDGFKDWAAMRRFWEANHPGVAVFTGETRQDLGQLLPQRSLGQQSVEMPSGLLRPQSPRRPPRQLSSTRSTWFRPAPASR